MNKTKIIIALVAGALCGMAIPAALIWSSQATIIGLAAGAIAAIAVTITGITVAKESK